MQIAVSAVPFATMWGFESAIIYCWLFVKEILHKKSISSGEFSVKTLQSVRFQTKTFSLILASTSNQHTFNVIRRVYNYGHFKTNSAKLCGKLTRQTAARSSKRILATLWLIPRAMACKYWARGVYLSLTIWHSHHKLPPHSRRSANNKFGWFSKRASLLMTRLSGRRMWLEMLKPRCAFLWLRFSTRKFRGSLLKSPSISSGFLSILTVY